MNENGFVFNSIIVHEESGDTSLCLGLDVASQEQTVEQARQALLEAVTLYVEAALEHNLPRLRPVPPAEDPRSTDLDHVVAEFPPKVSVAVHACA